MTLLLQIVASAEGVCQVDIHRGGPEGAQLYQALMPAIDAINRAIRLALQSPAGAAELRPLGSGGND